MMDLDLEQYIINLNNQGLDTTEAIAYLEGLISSNALEQLLKVL